MKKNTRKCPNCGANMPADARYCRKCNAPMDSGRVGTIPRPSRRDRDDDDALRNLPRPVRPTEELERPSSDSKGFFEPERGPSGGRGPRPMSTARGGSSPDYGPARQDRRMWQIAAVLAIILVIIVVAIVLVIKLNQRPAQQQQQVEASPEFQAVHVIESPSPSPTAMATPTAMPTPTATPLNNMVVSTLPMAATPSPIPSPSASPSPYNISAVNETVYLTGVGVNIRKGPGTDFDVVGTASTGATYTRTGRVSNGWSRISYNGGEAYINDSYLSTTQPTASPVPSFNVTVTGGTVTVTSDVNLRKGPGTNYESAGVVKTGTQLSRTGYTDSWTRVQYNGGEYFVYSTYVSDGSSGGNNNSSGGTTTSGTGTVRTSSGGPVNVRSGAGTGYSVIGSVSSGSTVTITAEYTGWYQINYNGQTGYISSQYVTKN